MQFLSKMGMTKSAFWYWTVIQLLEKESQSDRDKIENEKYRSNDTECDNQIYGGIRDVCIFFFNFSVEKKIKR